MPARSLGNVLGYFYSPIYTRLVKPVYFGLVLPLTMGNISCSVFPLLILVARMALAVASDGMCAIWAECNVSLYSILMIKDFVPLDCLYFQEVLVEVRR